MENGLNRGLFFVRWQADSPALMLACRPPESIAFLQEAPLYPKIANSNGIPGHTKSIVGATSKVGYLNRKERSTIKQHGRKRSA
jgi:hypothetical protein